MKKQTIFISGIAGFLGSHLADSMLAQGHRVVGCDSLIGGDRENVPAQADFYVADLNDYRAINNLVRHVDVVFHTAATAYDGLSVFSPHFITQNVYSNTISLLAAAIDNNVRRFVFCSSMARYGKQAVPFQEEMIPAPRTPYGIAKYAAEKTIESLCRIHQREYVICVPHNIIGPRQKYDDPFRNVAAIMINRMLLGKQPVIYGNGLQKRCFSYVKDTLQVLEKLVFDKAAVGQIINVGPDEEFVSVFELAKTIAGIIGFELMPIFVDGRPGEDNLANCSADKARKLFSYETKYTLYQGIKEMVDWIQIRGPKPFQYSIDIEIKNQLLPRTWREAII